MNGYWVKQCEPVFKQLPVSWHRCATGILHCDGGRDPEQVLALMKELTWVKAPIVWPTPCASLSKLCKCFVLVGFTESGTKYDRTHFFLMPEVLRTTGYQHFIIFDQHWQLPVVTVKLQAYMLRYWNSSTNTIRELCLACSTVDLNLPCP